MSWSSAQNNAVLYRYSLGSFKLRNSHNQHKNVKKSCRVRATRNLYTKLNVSRITDQALCHPMTLNFDFWPQNTIMSERTITLNLNLQQLCVLDLRSFLHRFHGGCIIKTFAPFFRIIWRFLSSARWHSFTRIALCNFPWHSIVSVCVLYESRDWQRMLTVSPSKRTSKDCESRDGRCVL